MGRGGRILVVDDEETVRLTLTAVLSSAGYEVASASTGADALALLQISEFDLVLTDLRLDDIDGLQILANVRKRWPDTVTLMLTGYASLDSAVAALRAGAYDYLCKPCPVDEILATVARGIERRRLGLEVKRNVRHLEVSIETARDLHSSLQTQVESMRTVLNQRDRLLQGLCTELKTSLLSVAGLTEVLLGRVVPAAGDHPEAVEIPAAQELVSYIEQIQAEAERLVEFVQTTSLSTTDDAVDEALDEPAVAPPQTTAVSPSPA
jgi:DNA-binding response OmpR family regulator